MKENCEWVFFSEHSVVSSYIHAQRRPAQCSCIIAWNDSSWRL